MNFFPHSASSQTTPVQPIADATAALCESVAQTAAMNHKATIALLQAHQNHCPPPTSTMNYLDPTIIRTLLHLPQL